MKLKKGMSICYRLVGESPVQKVEAREQPDLQGPIIYMCVCVGAVPVLTEKMTKIVESGSVGA